MILTPVIQMHIVLVAPRRGGGGGGGGGGGAKQQTNKIKPLSQKVRF